MVRVGWLNKSVSIALVILCICQPVQEAFALSVRPAPYQPQLKKVAASPVPQTYIALFCENNRPEACAAAQAWSWFRSHEIYIDIGSKMMMASGIIYATAFVARKIVGETTGVEFIYTISRAGFKTGAILIGGTVLVVTVGALVTTAAYVASASKAGDYLADKPDLARQCYDVDLNYYKTLEGQEKLQTMTLEEATKILPCIPADDDLMTALTEGAANGQTVLTETTSIPTTKQ